MMMVVGMAFDIWWCSFSEPRVKERRVSYRMTTAAAGGEHTYARDRRIASNGICGRQAKRLWRFGYRGDDGCGIGVGLQSLFGLYLRIGLPVCPFLAFWVILLPRSSCSWCMDNDLQQRPGVIAFLCAMPRSSPSALSATRHFILRGI